MSKLQTRAEQYKSFVRKRVVRSTTAVTYHNALQRLGENHIHKNIYDIKSVHKAQEIRTRLLKGGDLHTFNVDFQLRAMSGAMGMYVKFLRSEG